MRRTCAVAGPGPITSAYRRAISIPLVLPSRPASTNPNVQRPPAPKRRSQSAPQPKPGKDKAEETTESCLDYIPLLPAPPDHLHRAFVSLVPGFRDGLESENLREVLRIFAEMKDWNSLHLLNSKDWARLSDLITQEMTLRHAEKVIRRINVEEPEVYERLVTCAIEAAARSHWDALYHLFIALLAAGQPGNMVEPHRRYLRRIRQVQNKSLEDRFSSDRQVKLAARIECEGLQPIALTMIAAWTMLDQLSGHNMVSLLNTRTNWSRRNWRVESRIRQAIGLAARRNDRAKLKDGFKAALELFEFVVLCHHSAILRTELNNAAERGDQERYFSIYRRLLALSSGENRLLVPLDVGLSQAWRNRSRTDVVLPPDLWSNVLGQLSVLGLSHEIFRLIDVEFKNMDLVPGAREYSRAITALGRCYRPDQAGPIVRDYIETLFKQAEQKGMQGADEMVSAKITIEYMLNNGRAHDGLQANVERDPILRNGLFTRMALVRSLIRLDRCADALAILKWRTSSDPSEAKLYQEFFYQVVRFNRLSFRAQADFMQTALELKPKNLQLHPSTRALMLAYHARAKPELAKQCIDRVVAIVLGNWNDPRFWIETQAALKLIVSIGITRHRADHLGAEIGIRILKSLAAEPAARLQSSTRLEVLWQSYSKKIAQSTILTRQERIFYLAEALKVLEGLTRPSSRFLFAMVQWLISRHDDVDAAEGMAWWNAHLKPRSPSAFWWSKLVFTLKRVKQDEHAVDLVKAAWDQQWVVPSSRFWDDMKAAGILQEAGISAVDLHEARNRLLAAPPTEQDDAESDYRQDDRTDVTSADQDWDALEEDLAEIEEDDNIIQIDRL